MKTRLDSFALFRNIGFIQIPEHIKRPEAKAIIARANKLGDDQFRTAVALGIITLRHH